MVIQITSGTIKEGIRLEAEIAPDAKRLVLVDASGREYHFGCGVWTPAGTFIHVATYTRQGREPYAWWSDVLEGLERGVEVRVEPELGPRVTPLVEVGLMSLAQLCNQVNGFYTEPEKKWAVEHLRALWDEAGEPLDADEVAVWIATHGWAPKHAKTIRDITEGVRSGRRFMGAGRAIRRDRDHERKMVGHWREHLAARSSSPAGGR